MMRIGATLFPLIAFFVAIGFLIRGFLIGSILIPLLALILILIYVASGAWRVFALREVR